MTGLAARAGGRGYCRWCRVDHPRSRVAQRKAMQCAGCSEPVGIHLTVDRFYVCPDGPPFCRDCHEERVEALRGFLGDDGE